MNQNPVKTIGIKDESRKDAYLSNINQKNGLKDILKRDFHKWSNLDSWESISIQQWIFTVALDVCRGKKVDIKCDCCEYIDFFSSDFDNIQKEKCYGRKTAYMIDKVVDEILLAKAMRENDGTYFS